MRSLKGEQLARAISLLLVFDWRLVFLNNISFKFKTLLFRLINFAQRNYHRRFVSPYPSTLHRNYPTIYSRYYLIPYRCNIILIFLIPDAAVYSRILPCLVALRWYSPASWSLTLTRERYARCTLLYNKPNSIARDTSSELFLDLFSPCISPVKIAEARIYSKRYCRFSFTTCACARA